jgi:hypothetical protein
MTLRYNLPFDVIQSIVISPTKIISPEIKLKTDMVIKITKNASGKYLYSISINCMLFVWNSLNISRKILN